ncbi:GDP-mannose-dependent alpha-(1-6)-phosphatidylinositol monomannoside mannosyltransferase [compost metagenome]
MIKDCWKVSRKFKVIAPDIIHSFHYSSNYTEAISARMAGIPWTFTKKNMSWGGSSKNSWTLRSFLAKKIIVQNTDMQYQFYPNSSKITLIPRGVVLEKFKADFSSPEIKEKMATQSGHRVLICVANFVPVKGVETLIEAFSKVQEKHSDWVLWLVGDDRNEYAQKLRQMVMELGLNNKIVFSGKQLNVVDYLNHAEIFVLPTLDEGRREGSPVALLEAMANGKVVLGSRVAGIKDQLADFPEHLFSARDVLSLSEKLTHFMNMNSEELSHKGKQFSTLVQERYSIATEIEKHQQHYLSLL